MDLLRIPGLLMYMIRLCLARSAADRRNVKRVRRTDTDWEDDTVSDYFFLFTVASVCSKGIVFSSVDLCLVLTLVLSLYKYIEFNKILSRRSRHFVFSPSAPGLWVPVRSSVRLDDECLHSGDGLQHYLPHHRPLRSVSLTLYCRATATLSVIQH